MAKILDQISDLAKFATDTASAALKGKDIRVSPEVATKRYNICLACPELVAGKCKKCGCKMGLKVQWTEATCGDKENPRW